MSPNPNNTPIATAPEVPSSTNINYYDPRSTSNYYSSASATPVQQSIYMNPNALQSQSDMNSVASVAAVAAAAAAAAGLPPNNSLPPLSHLLPSNSNNNNNDNNNNNGAKNSNSRQPNDDASQNIEIQSARNNGDYFSPQNKNVKAIIPTSTVNNRQPPGAGGGGGGSNGNDGATNVYMQQQRAFPPPASVPSHPSNTTYRKSVDYQRTNMFPPSSDMSRRGYLSTQAPPPPLPHQNGYYMLPPQHQHQANSLSHYGPPAPSTIVPSSDLSVFPPPHLHHPSNLYHTSRGHGHLYHLPSPPTSVIDGVLITDPNSHQHVINGGITNNSQKVFSFVPLPGLNQKKRPRRKFHEVERLYQCNFQDCTKSYGTLNHLNAHVSMQGHGPKRQPSEFKELRKMWRKQKRDIKQRSGSRSTTQSLEEEGDLQQQQDIMNSSSMPQENTILSHSSLPILSSSRQHQNQLHHDYANSMPPYMHHPHPSLMSHPPPPPPPPNAHWMNRTQHAQYHHAAEFMPQGY